MRLITATILLILAVISGIVPPAGAQQAPLGQASSTEQNLDAAKVSTRADGWLSAYEKAGDFTGVVLLAQGDKVLFEKAYGYADSQVRSPNRLDTRFRVASLSKTFTTAAIEQLVKQGKVRYSDSLSRYVAGVPNGDSITIEQLLTHQSGIGVLDSEDVYHDCISPDDLLQRLADAKPSLRRARNPLIAMRAISCLLRLLSGRAERRTKHSCGKTFLRHCRWGIPGLLAAIFRRGATPSAT